MEIFVFSWIKMFWAHSVLVCRIAVIAAGINCEEKTPTISLSAMPHMDRIQLPLGVWALNPA